MFVITCSRLRSVVCKCRVRVCQAYIWGKCLSEVRDLTTVAARTHELHPFVIPLVRNRCANSHYLSKVLTCILRAYCLNGDILTFVTFWIIKPGGGYIPSNTLLNHLKALSSPLVPNSLQDTDNSVPLVHDVAPTAQYFVTSMSVSLTG